MRPLRVVVVLVPAVLLAGCGGGGGPESPARAAVRQYLVRVNEIEVEMRGPLAQLSRVDAKRETAEARAARLAKTERLLRRLESRLAAAHPPPAARRLRSLLLALVRREVSLADELRAAAVFDPRFTAALKPLAAANTTANAALAATHDPVEVAAAVSEYRSAVRSVRGALGPLRPPAFEEPLYRAQVARLEQLDRALAQLETAVGRRDATAIAVAQHAVSVASVSTDSAANQRAERAAVVAYNARVASIGRLARRAQLERNRLQVGL